MKLYAHRGWAMGPDENTIAAFDRAAKNPEVDGVEFDIRRSRDGQLIVIHDPPQPGDNPPSLNEVLERLKPTSLGILLEIKEPGLAVETIKALKTHELEDRSTVFGFPGAAASFPWNETRAVRLGLIAHLPWQAKALISQYRPDVFMLGWNRHAWTRMAFRFWWSCFSLRRFGERYSLPIVVGIVRRKSDHDWLRRRDVGIAVTDLDQIDTIAVRQGTS